MFKPEMKYWDWYNAIVIFRQLKELGILHEKELQDFRRRAERDFIFRAKTEQSKR